MTDLSFYPDGVRAKQIDARMRGELAKSLVNVRNQLIGQGADEVLGLDLRELDSVLRQLDGGDGVNPEVFGRYYWLVLSILENGDRVGDNYRRLINAVATSKPPLTFNKLSADDLGDEDTVNLYQSCFDTDDKISFVFHAPDETRSERGRANVERGLALLRQFAPELADEFSGLVNEVILAYGGSDKSQYTFDGGSSYMLWGALLLNVDEEKTDLQMAETLAHESAHSFLFGLTIDEALVLNNDDDRYKSPLRRDRRPMDGIYHATYVSARMHYAMRRALQSGVLDSEQQAECSQYLAASRKAFFDGYQVVDEYAQYSATGKAVMQHAYDYMTSVGVGEV